MRGRRGRSKRKEEKNGRKTHKPRLGRGRAEKQNMKMKTEDGGQSKKKRQ